MPSISILFSDGQRLAQSDLGRQHAGHNPAKAGAAGSVSALQSHEQLERSASRRHDPAVSLCVRRSPMTRRFCVYPMGTLSVRENVVPLDVPITSYGNATPSDGNLFAISDVQINGQEESRSAVPGVLRPGQFNALSDADKLSLPSFENYDAGVTIGSASILTGKNSSAHDRLRRDSNRSDELLQVQTVLTP